MGHRRKSDDKTLKWVLIFSAVVIFAIALFRANIVWANPPARAHDLEQQYLKMPDRVSRIYRDIFIERSRACPICWCKREYIVRVSPIEHKEISREMVPGSLICWCEPPNIKQNRPST